MAERTAWHCWNHAKGHSGHGHIGLDLAESNATAPCRDPARRSGPAGVRTGLRSESPSRTLGSCLTVEGSRPPYEQEPVSFRDPPVIEVALSIQFDRPITHPARTLGEFWPLIRDDFPGLQEQPALPAQREEFGLVVGPQVEFMMQPPAPRYWFVSGDDTRLIQLQPDRIMYNWRKTHPAQEYPRYRQLRPDFERFLHMLLELLAEDERSLARPDWCEVTYVNHILPGDGEKTRPPLHEVVRVVEAPPPSPPGIELEDVQLTQRYLLKKEGASAPSGRLHVTAVPAVRNADQMPMYALTLVARGQAGGSVEGALAFIDQGRELIVTTFRDITTPSMHGRWGLES